MTKNKDETEIQEKFKTLIFDKRFMELAHLIAHTRQAPPDYIVRMGFRMYMEKKRSNRVKLFFVMKLKEITKVTPEDDILEEIIKTSFEMGSPHILASLCNRLDIAQEVFQNMTDELQEAYLGHVKKGVFANVEKLMEITAVDPSEEIIQQGYKYYLEEGKLISFTGLKNRTGIKPDRKMVLEIFKLYQDKANKFEIDNKRKKNPEGNIWKKRVERLRKAMGSKTKEERGAAIS
ncbi:MAG: hypothetical protein GY950_18280 [bacterium]|nr:hypothetical protein [bacterium]